MHDGISRNVYHGELLAQYGGLLTPRQRELLRYHVDEDYSLAEIAEQEGISRQGVHDAVKRATAQLEEWEDECGLIEKKKQTHTLLRSMRENVELLSDPHKQTLCRQLDSLWQIWEENDGV